MSGKSQFLELSPETYISPTLLDLYFRVPWLQWPLPAVVIAVVFLLLLGGAGLLDRSLPSFLDIEFLRYYLQWPILVIFALATYRWLITLRTFAVASFSSYVVMEGEAFARYVTEISVFNRRYEVLAFVAGMAVGGLFSPFWKGPDTFFWLRQYWSLAVMALIGFGFWVIYATVVYNRMMSQLLLLPQEIDIFNLRHFEPIARWSLGISLSVIGTMTLFLVITPDPRFFLNWEVLLPALGLLVFTISIFFFSLLSAHRVMAAAKETELQTVRSHLATVYRQLKVQAQARSLQDMEALSDSVSAWLSYEKRIQEAPEWPYTADTLRRLILSTLLPLAAWVGNILIDRIR
ncbi:MAG: hypothetical protein EXR62_13035 [Chloroflexi bacterium]|nr:hypothetical protein [Chloroflexota bacterium]